MTPKLRSVLYEGEWRHLWSFMEISDEVSARSPDHYSPIVGVDKLSSKVQAIRARVNC